MLNAPSSSLVTHESVEWTDYEVNHDGSDGKLRSMQEHQEIMEVDYYPMSTFEASHSNLRMNSSKPAHRKPYPFTTSKKRKHSPCLGSSLSAFGTFRSYALVELQNQGYARPTSKLLANVWLSMNAKERRPWKLLAARLSSNPVLGEQLQSAPSHDLKELSTRLREAALDEGDVSLGSTDPAVDKQ